MRQVKFEAYLRMLNNLTKSVMIASSSQIQNFYSS